MKKIVAMIPARLGSKRVKKKNLREINGKPLICYIIEAAIKSGEFDEIYLNSEAEAEFAPIAEQYGIKFYKRNRFFSTDSSTNDHFMADFLTHVECDAVVQLLPTSPFITAEIIKDFVKKFKDESLDTLISVKNVKIECLYKGSPINFDDKDITQPSQLLEPIQAYACGIMAWDRLNYLQNYDTYEAAYHGGDGKKGTFVISGFATVDIDEEDDFKIAEVIAKSIEPIPYEKEYWFVTDDSIPKIETIEKNPLATHTEVDVPSILAKDGVEHNDLHNANKEIVSVPEIIKQMDETGTSWSKRLMDTSNNSCTLICQNAGESNRRHYHDDFDEFWLILRGEYIFEIDGVDHTVKEGDFIIVQRNSVHYMTSLKDGSIRMAVSRANVNHIYT